ncbi:MAG TPA: hypothetical protein VFK89_10385 [Actinomycetota bacterium]|nr:hypothetical protein [Actinomycetota bacterium]
MKRRLWILPLLGAIVMIPLVAGARHMDLTDRNDTKGLLDVQKVFVGGKRAKPRWKIVTYPRWTPRSIWDAGILMVHLDTYGDSDFDYVALARSNGSRMVAEVLRHRNGKPDKSLFFIDTRRPSKRSDSFVVPLPRLRRRPTKLYRWYVETSFSSDVCRRYCFDRVPDSGFVTEGAKPRPTPTVTITPTVTPSP